MLCTLYNLTTILPGGYVVYTLNVVSKEGLILQSTGVVDRGKEGGRGAPHLMLAATNVTDARCHALF